jgi:prepilin-type N-terminal cleavage/methylation domain-containing protein
MKKNRFTLIELLVVISIIAILSSLLMPALNNARRSAKSICCINTLKQLGNSIVLYMDSFNGILVTESSYVMRNTGATYSQCLSNAGFIDKNHPESFMCPEAEPNSAWSNGVLLTADRRVKERAYGINYFGVRSENGIYKGYYTEQMPESTNSNDRIIRITKIKKPSTYVFLIDNKMDDLMSNFSKANLNSTPNSYSYPPWTIHSPEQSVNILRGDFGAFSAPCPWLLDNCRVDMMFSL